MASSEPCEGGEARNHSSKGARSKYESHQNKNIQSNQSNSSNRTQFGRNNSIDEVKNESTSENGASKKSNLRGRGRRGRGSSFYDTHAAYEEPLHSNEFSYDRNSMGNQRNRGNDRRGREFSNRGYSDDRHVEHHISNMNGTFNDNVPSADHSLSSKYENDTQPNMEPRLGESRHFNQQSGGSRGRNFDSYYQENYNNNDTMPGYYYEANGQAQYRGHSDHYRGRGLYNERNRQEYRRGGRKKAINNSRQHGSDADLSENAYGGQTDDRNNYEPSKSHHNTDSSRSQTNNNLRDKQQRNGPKHSASDSSTNYSDSSKNAKVRDEQEVLDKRNATVSGDSRPRGARGAIFTDSKSSTDNKSIGVSNSAANIGNASEKRKKNENKQSEISEKPYNDDDLKKMKSQIKNLNINQINYKAPQLENEGQRDSLIEQLQRSNYECMVCCNVVRRDTAIWTCDGCYHMFHLYCIKKWAKSSMTTAQDQNQEGSGWRCPACQKVCQQWPLQYTCFCGKQKNPTSSQHITPHSCGEMCGKSRTKTCTHACTLLCHPGPCPDCQAFVNRTCLCGKSSRNTRCCNNNTYRCEAPCNKTRNCGRHSCTAGCHSDACEPCEVLIEQKCYCLKVSRSVICGSAESFNGAFSCKEVCARKLDCMKHECGAVCHAGTCEPCRLQPSVLKECPCGQTMLKDLGGNVVRTACTDPIPCCDKICNKILPCGSDEDRHRCKNKCHVGACPSCPGEMSVDCQCGSMATKMLCREALTYIITEASADERRTTYKCSRRCNKKMSCGRHRCSNTCCTSADHKCLLICGYKLSCGLHKCEETCHKGTCGACWHVSFEELRCHCGAEVIYPPVPCGTRPPECRNRCTRQHACNHPVLHNCHSDERCPQCTTLTERWCMGRHELRRNIPCYLTDISCGLVCGKPLPCGQHKCISVCHKGDCLAEGDTCTQPCTLIRAECGHACLTPCHPGAPCPSSQCRAEIVLRCECGRREEKTLCMQISEARSGTSDYNKMAAQLVASKLWESQSIDVTVLSKELSGNKKMKKLQCNQECAVQERNQRLALALEIKNPDLSAKLGNPTYPQFLKDYAKQNAGFVAKVEETLSQLVTATLQPKMTKKSHAFKSMPSVQRRVIHELAPFYGCTTESYDEEPNKNVVATAIREKCWHPSVSLTSLTQRELFGKAPVPVPIHSKEEDIRTAVQAAKQSTQVFSLSTAKSTSGKSGRNKEHEIDYFDMTD